MLKKITDLIESKKLNTETPYFLFDKGRIVHNVLFFKHKLNLRDEDIYFSVKANNHPEILKELKILGTGFDMASLSELQTIVNQDIDGENVIFTNPVKIPKHISIANKFNVNKFTFDTYGELNKISKNAPFSKVFARLKINNTGAEWTLDNKFGASANEIVNLFKKAINLDLVPYGISIHNGWNNTNTDTWKENLQICSKLIAECFDNDIKISCLNLGGGFPAHNIDQYQFLDKLAEEILPIIDQLKAKYNLRIIAEPGSFIVNYSGALIVRIYDIIQRENKKWIFIDSGIMQGFPWALTNLKYDIHYPYKIYEDTKTSNYMITGPTNDSKDIFGEYHLPENIKINDFLIVYPAGAYSNSSESYNGYKMPEVRFLG